MARVALVLVAAGVLGVGVFTFLSGRGPAAPPTLEARTLQVEQQLLCPQCTNKRLDVCELAICQDMRREIRTRLEQGESEAAIVAFFSGRFGDRVLATVPRSGFNLWLWGWVVGSVVVVGALGARWLRAQTRRSAAPPLVESDDRWLDAQLGR